MLSPATIGPVVPWDRTLFQHVNGFARDTPLLHATMLDYAGFGVVVFAGLLLVGWWVARASGDHVRVAAALWAPLGTLSALALNQPLVNLFREPRPYTVLPHTMILVSRSSDWSFPSDHAVMAGAVTAGLFLVNRRLGMVTAVAALMMALARVYVGAHWPGDVMVGLVVGAVVTWAGFMLIQRPAVALVGALVRTPLRPLLVAGHPAAGTDHDGAGPRLDLLRTGTRGTDDHRAQARTATEQHVPGGERSRSDGR